MPKAQGVDIGHEVEKIGAEEEKDDEEEEEIIPTKTKMDQAKEIFE